jgi:transcriptional regulator with XRE-family HTH domain
VTDPNSSPLAFLADEIKRMRELAGMTQEALASETGYAPPTVAAIETSRLIPSQDFTESADKHFGTDGILSRLRAMVEETSARPWFRDLLKVEQKATEIQTYETYAIPGLLQTESYMRHAVNATRPILTRDEIDRAVALRMTRQEILQRDDSPQLWAIIDESALYRVNGDAEVMREQRDHLVTMCERPNIVIQVIPLAEGLTAAGGRAFTIMSFKAEPAVVYLEDVGSARYIRNRKTDEVQRYALTFDHLRCNALTDEKSVTLIRGEQ